MTILFHSFLGYTLIYIYIYIWYLEINKKKLRNNNRFRAKPIIRVHPIDVVLKNID